MINNVSFAFQLSSARCRKQIKNGKNKSELDPVRYNPNRRTAGSSLQPLTLLQTTIPRGSAYTRSKVALLEQPTRVVDDINDRMNTIQPYMRRAHAKNIPNEPSTP